MSRRRRYTRNLGRTLASPLPARPAQRYVRFKHATERFGLFSYLSDARAALERDALAELATVVAWFNEHLDAPTRMVPFRNVGRHSGSRYACAQTTAVCWFRDDAHDHIARARRLAALVRRAGIPIVEQWTTKVPGKICSEDVAQIAVQQFRDVG